MPQSRSICDSCGVRMPPHEHFVVKIDIFADPAMPAIDTVCDAAETSGESIEKLIGQMKSMSTDDLQDAVHRRFEFNICSSCQKDVLANPLGRPRPNARRAIGEN